MKEFPEFNNHERPDKKNTENKNGQEMEESEENGEDSEEREAIPNRKLKLPIQLCYFRLKILLRKHFWMGRANMVMTVCQVSNLLKYFLLHHPQSHAMGTTNLKIPDRSASSASPVRDNGCQPRL